MVKISSVLREVYHLLLLSFFDHQPRNWQNWAIFLYLTPKLSGISEKIFKFAFKYNILQRMEDRELLQKSDPEFDRLAFTVLAIEASAQKMGISPSEMRKRLDKVGLIKSLIQDCYDTLHTESREAVASDVVEALKNWERKE